MALSLHVLMSDTLMAQFRAPASWPGKSVFYLFTAGSHSFCPCRGGFSGSIQVARLFWLRCQDIPDVPAGDGGYVAPERDAGIAIMAPVWIPDASVCKTMTLGSPVISLPDLLDLHEILRPQGFRRGFDEDEPVEGDGA